MMLAKLTVLPRALVAHHIGGHLAYLFHANRDQYQIIISTGDYNMPSAVGQEFLGQLFSLEWRWFLIVSALRFTCCIWHSKPK